MADEEKKAERPGAAPERQKLPMVVFPRQGTFLLVGDVGMGKTTRTVQLVMQLLADGRDLALVHDPWNEGDFPGRVWRGVNGARASKQPLARINVFPGGLGEDNASKAAEVAQFAVELGDDKRLGTRHKRVVLVIDELDMISRPGQLFDDPPRAKGEPIRRGNVYNVLNYSRHVHVDLVGTCRRPTDLYVQFGGLAQRIYFFASAERNTNKWIEDTCGEDVARACSRLQPYEHIEWVRAGPPGQRWKLVRPAPPVGGAHSRTRRAKP